MRVQPGNGDYVTVVCRRRVLILVEFNLVHAALEFAGSKDGKNGY
jgi:hypothetical protein